MPISGALMTINAQPFGSGTLANTRHHDERLMPIAQWLPHVNASLNLLATGLLIAARVEVARGHIDAHRRWMTAALIVSALFLIGYGTYHYLAPIFVFRGTGWIRPVYYALLISHVVLAALSLPMILGAALLGATGRVSAHRKLARWTWPLWFYVSVSGVVVYLLLYQIYHPA